VAKSKLDRAKDLPWLMMLQGAVVLGRRWSALSKKDRARLTRILRESKGHMGRLSAKERSELRRLAGKLDLKGAGRELMLIRAARRGRKRR